MEIATTELLQCNIVSFHAPHSYPFVLPTDNPTNSGVATDSNPQSIPTRDVMDSSENQTDQVGAHISRESSSNGPNRPLALAIEAHMQAAGEPPSRYMRCLQNLFQLFIFALSPSFVRRLSTNERHVMGLFLEWWWRRNDEALTHVKERAFACALAYEIIESREGAVRKLEHVTPDPDLPILRRVETELANPEAPLHGVVTRVSSLDILGISSYHDVMFSLFTNQFGGSELAHLDNYPAAFSFAAAMRVSHAAFQSTLRNLTKPDDAQAMPKTRGDQGLLSSTRIIPTVFDCCSWLKNETPQVSFPGCADNLPYFLWDIECERTVEVSKLAISTITYCIVSHTWGRWRKDGDGAMLPGLPWWRVPENTRFDVMDLPKMLKSAGFAERYVWFDLLCIPQRSSDDTLARICQVEIARQATIFGNAQTAVAWLNDIETWTDAEATIAWLGIDWLQTTTDESIHLAEVDAILDAARGPASRSCGLLTNKSSTGVLEKLPGWMSSLWTLQEIIMKPDMLLLDKHWRPLLAGGVVPVTFASLAQLVGPRADQVDSEMDNPTDTINWERSCANDPRGVAELHDCLARTGMLQLDGPNRLTPLILGRSRQCTNSRAEAIMSVTGATEWYLGRTIEQFRASTDEAKEDLVCGLYPLEFVRELQMKTGGSFFMSVHDIPTLAAMRGRGGDKDEVSLQGTMLPFMSQSRGGVGGGNHFGSSVGLYEDVDHPSVSSWEIQRDGSVRLLTVGIVASNFDVTGTDEPQPKYSVLYRGNDPVHNWSDVVIREVNVDLIDWLSKFEGEAYAICAIGSKSAMQGVIIHRLDQGEGPFIKAGTFRTWPH